MSAKAELSSSETTNRTATTSHRPMQPVAKRYERYIYPVLFILLDYAAILAAEYGALGITDAIDPRQTLPYHIGTSYMYGWMPLIYIIFLGRSRAYREMQPMLDTVRSVFHSVGFGAITTIVMLYFVAPHLLSSRLFLVLDFLLMLLFIYAVRIITCILLKKFHLFYVPVILIGAGHTAERILRFYRSDLGFRYDVLGLIDDNPKSEIISEQIPLLGSMKEAERIVRKSGVQTVIIAVPGMDKSASYNMIGKMQHYVRRIQFTPDLIDMPMMNAEVNVLLKEHVVIMNIKNNLARRRNRILKRMTDIVGSIFGLLVLSPILLAISLAIAAKDGFPVIFSYTCIGRNGKPFQCYKFRSMIKDSQRVLKEYLEQNPAAREEWDRFYKLKDDPRVTPIGRIIRHASIDELPQLWNVLKGDMSLVGPRQIVPDEMKRYGIYLRDRLMVRPGMTGYWQVNGRSEVDYSERVVMDTWYIRNWSVWIDIMIIFKTIKIVICGKGAY